ncbi:MAG: hypothetical protein ACI4WM_07905 [Erysipelotrichaceae bacterium]
MKNELNEEKLGNVSGGRFEPDILEPCPYNISEEQFPDAIVPHGDNTGKNGHCVKAGWMCRYFSLHRDGETCQCNARGYEGKL